MILLPTLNRIQKLTHFLKSYHKAKSTCPGLIIVDEKDHVQNNEDYNTLATSDLMPKNWEMVITKAVTMGDKCREVWPRVESLDWVGILNDDHEIITEEWDKRLVSKLDGKNFVSCSDRWNAPRKAAGATLWSMPLLKALDWPIYPPHLQHLFIDDIWENLGRHTGCWRIDMSTVVVHNHALKEKFPDSTHNKVYSQKAWQLDHGIYTNFMQHDFQDAINKVRQFINEVRNTRYNPVIKREA